MRMERWMISEQDTQPLPVIRLHAQPEAMVQEAPQAKYRRLKALSDATGVRLLFVYLCDQRRYLRSANMQSPTARNLPNVPTSGGHLWPH